MPRPPKFAAVDALCREWGRTRRQLLGIEEPSLAREYLGALRSTLAARRDLHAGARSAGRVEQRFPEVYTGDARRVNGAFHAMAQPLRVVMDVHYVARAPAAEKARFLCVSQSAYWREVSAARAFVDGWLAREEQIAVSSAEF